jgi:ABC-2 type transport system permease protein
MNAFGKLLRSELRLLLREPMAVFFALLFPPILIIILGSVPAFRKPDAALGGLRVIDLYVTITITLILAMTALQFTPFVLANYREKGVLRRLSTTPVHPGMLLAAQMVASLLTAMTATALVLVTARIAFAVKLPAELAGYALALVLAATALFSLGLFIAAVAPSGRGGNAIGTILFFPVMFFAGLYVPREVMPVTLQRISDLTPLGAGEHAMHDAAIGLWPHAGQLAMLVAYLVVFGFAAVRLFRWE